MNNVMISPNNPLVIRLTNAGIDAILPKHLTKDRMAQFYYVAAGKNRALSSCTDESIVKSLMDLSQLGLEPDGRKAHLIPYGRECTVVIDYKGIVELIMRTGLVSRIQADVVCENDEFEFNMGEVVKHKIDFRKPRGEMYAVYSIVYFKDGTKRCECMSRDEVEKIRSRSKAGKSGPWMTDFNEMAKKTVFKRLSKWIPISSEMRDAIEIDDEQYRHEASQQQIITVAPSGGENGLRDRLGMNNAVQPPVSTAPTLHPKMYAPMALNCQTAEEFFQLMMSVDQDVSAGKLPPEMRDDTQQLIRNIANEQGIDLNNPQNNSVPF